MEFGKTFCGRADGRTYGRTDGRTHLSSNLLGHRRGDDLKNGTDSGALLPDSTGRACDTARKDEDRCKESETYEIWAYKSASMVSWTE